jgi:hypothetical protein
VNLVTSTHVQPTFCFYLRLQVGAADAGVAVTSLTAFSRGPYPCNPRAGNVHVKLRSFKVVKGYLVPGPSTCLMFFIFKLFHARSDEVVKKQCSRLLGIASLFSWRNHLWRGGPLGRSDQ